MHDGQIIEENIENYNAQEVEDRLNTQELNKVMVSFGSTVVSRHNIKMIRPVEIESEPTV